MINGDPARRTDLAGFLRARRADVRPEDVGLTPGSRRRTPGLRREEVALLAGVSVSWYTWLEQGRRINASVDVLDALARVLRLDPAEHAHLVALAGHAPSGSTGPTPRSTTSTEDDVPAPLWRLLDQLDPVPAYVLSPHWDYLAWNQGHQRLFPALPSLPDDERNLMWVVFADAHARDLIVGWESEARRVLSQFRADTVTHRNDPAMAALVERLTGASDDFARWWPHHDVAAPDTRVRRFDHPLAGPLAFELQQLVPADASELRVFVHLPIPGDDSLERLSR